MNDEVKQTTDTPATLEGDLTEENGNLFSDFADEVEQQDLLATRGVEEEEEETPVEPPAPEEVKDEPVQSSLTEEAEIEETEEPAEDLGAKGEVEETPVTPTPKPVDPEPKVEVEATKETRTEPEVVEEQPTQPKGPTEEEVKAAQEALEKQLVENTYALSEEESDQMLLEPGKVLPKLAAKLHMTVMESLGPAMVAQIPRIVQAQLKQNETVSAQKQRFYAAWPKLVGHEQEVAQVAQIYGQLNPTATPEKTIEDIGKHVMYSLGLPVGTPEPAPAPKPKSTGAGRPANPGGGKVPKTPTPKNPFELLADEMDTYFDE